MNSRKQLTEEEIQAALNKFLVEGGLIQKLPDEVALRVEMVGKKYGRFETFFDNNFGLEDGFSSF